MKKTTQDFISSDNESKVEKNILEDDKVKTTNVNILLNRVRLDRKRTLTKKIIFSLILVSIISALSVFFII